MTPNPNHEEPMKTAEEILSGYKEWNYGQYRTQDVIAAMQEYRNQPGENHIVQSNEMVPVSDEKVEEAAKQFSDFGLYSMTDVAFARHEGFIAGANWQATRHPVSNEQDKWVRVEDMIKPKNNQWVHCARKS